MSKTKTSSPGGGAAGKYVRAAAARAACDGERGATAAAASTGLRGWIARARGAGLSVSEMVLELHVRQGVPLLAVAGALGVDYARVLVLWEEVRAGLAKRAAKPEDAAGLQGMREHIGAVLWRTVEVTFPELPLGAVADESDGAAAADDDDAAAAAGLSAGGTAVAAPMLSVRLKALDQLTKLYDLNLARTAEEDETVPYAAPAEIAAAVRERVLGMWGR